MLQQERISQIALLVSIAGVALLLLSAELLEARQVKIGEIDETMIGLEVRVEARVLSKYEKDNIVFMQLYDGTGKIKAVVFNASEEQRALIGKGFASFEGKVQLYREELELVVEEVRQW